EQAGRVGFLRILVDAHQVATLGEAPPLEGLGVPDPLLPQRLVHRVALGLAPLHAHKSEAAAGIVRPPQANQRRRYLARVLNDPHLVGVFLVLHALAGLAAPPLEQVHVAPDYPAPVPLDAPPDLPAEGLGDLVDR